MTENDKLTEELFCLRYELNTLANMLLRHTSERWLPGFIQERTEFSHTDRYLLACKYTEGKKVIDIACGAGKGANLIATEGAAAFVDGFDIQPETIRYANWRYNGNNINFEVKDAEKFNECNQYDIAVSFETIEHLSDYRKFLINIKNCLKPNGVFIVSTPISPLKIDNQPDNPYHVQEWGFREFQDVLSKFFHTEKIYVQLYPKVDMGPVIVKKNLFNRAIKKFIRIIGIKKTTPNASSPIAVQKFSKIEEYFNQYPENELGASRTGYQIVIAKKVNE